MKVIIDNVSKVFDHPQHPEKKVVAVNKVSLTIAEGEMVTLLGPSGCGKTTTLRMVAGFETVSEGRILIDGVDVTYVPPNKRDTAMVFQSYAIFPHLDVRGNVSFGLNLKKHLSEAERKARVDRVLSLVGLTGLEDRSPEQLSGGQQQRVALARAIVNEPSVLLFDEPLSNLDAKLRESMRNEIRALQQRIGITGLYVTHDQAEAMALSDRIVIMRDGVVEQVGTPTEIYTRPVNHFVADFIGRANFIGGRVATKRAEQGQEMYEVHVGELSILVPCGPTRFGEGDFVDILVRPENLRLHRPDAEADGHGLMGVVEKVTYLGSTVEYSVQAGGQSLLAVVSNPLVEGLYRVGDQVRLTFDARVAHLLPRQ